MAKQKLPAFSELPLREGDPPFSAWGLYGKDDELGTLNRLTDEVVLEASKEIQSGVRISLNWPLDAQSSRPLFGREAFHSHLYQKGTRIVNDDVWTFNTQSSSQWDGLRHFGYQKEERFYNGVTLADIHAEDEHGNKTSTINGIGKWSEKGIVGRGVLLDFEAWRMTGQDGAEREYDAFSSDSAISLEELKKVAKAQGTTFRFGDILIVRSGFMAAYAKKSAEELSAHQETQPRSFGGVEQGEEVLEWLWENGFAAVAGDAPAFERWTSPTPYPLHEILLAGWGCPIGELFDLEALSAHCKATGRYSFFITSEVTNVPGGVASPPNILAIF